MVVHLLIIDGKRWNHFADSKIYRIFAASIIDKYEISYRNTELREGQE
jgi:hypothetical protein